MRAGERLVTSMFADVRGYTPLTSASTPEDLADRITTLHRWAAAEVGRRYGIVDKFAGDAVMATFNAAGTRVDHAALALDAALAIRDKAALMDLPVGIGIAVGPAVVTRSVGDANVSVLGEATNLAARLENAAGGGEILLSDEAFRRVSEWLDDRGLAVEREAARAQGLRRPAAGLPAGVVRAGGRLTGAGATPTRAPRTGASRAWSGSPRSRGASSGRRGSAASRRRPRRWRPRAAGRG